jgi:hypothetical protein
MAWSEGSSFARRTAAGGCPHKSKVGLSELVAAGVGLRGHQHQAWASRNRLGIRWMAERAQDTEDCDVSGEYAEADGRDHGEAED